MSKQRNKAPQVAIEICSTMLHLAILHNGRSDSSKAELHSLLWRDQATTLHSPAGVKELAAALRSLATDHRLQGVTVRLALSGAFCVTRAVSDTADRVRREVSDLGERSQHYLALGTGKKTIAVSIHQIDARHQLALATVCNQQTLDAIVDAANVAGLKIEAIEPSLVSLCRLTQSLKDFGEQTSAIIHLDHHGVELGVTHAGRLLLDFRPGGRSEKRNAAELVKQHLERLERYCDRHAEINPGALKRAYLCGPSSIAQNVYKDLAAQGEIEPAYFDLSQFRVTGLHEDGTPSAAALGASLANGPGVVSTAPNLLERRSIQRREGLGREVARLLAPVAALLFIAIGGVLAVQVQSRVCQDLQRQLDELAPVRTKAVELRLKLQRSESKLAQLNQIAVRVRNPGWNEMVSSIGQCLPPDVWLDRVSVDDRGMMKLVGSSFSDAGVYEFVDSMKDFPTVQDVALQGTHPGGSLLGPVTNFDVECKFADQVDLAKEGLFND